MKIQILQKKNLSNFTYNFGHFSTNLRPHYKKKILNIFLLFCTPNSRMSCNMCIWRHKLCNAKTAVGPTFTWSNEPWCWGDEAMAKWHITEYGLSIFWVQSLLLQSSQSFLEFEEFQDQYRHVNVLKWLFGCWERRRRYITSFPCQYTLQCPSRFPPNITLSVTQLDMNSFGACLN